MALGFVISIKFITTAYGSWQDELETKPQLAKNDPREIQKFYQSYYDQYIKEGPIKRKPWEWMSFYFKLIFISHLTIPGGICTIFLGRRWQSITRLLLYCMMFLKLWYLQKKSMMRFVHSNSTITCFFTCMIFCSLKFTIGMLYILLPDKKVCKRSWPKENPLCSV